MNALHLSAKQAIPLLQENCLHFHLKNEDLNKKWIHFVNRKDWVPTKHSVLCELYFEDIYKNTGKCMSLTWSMKPVPTIYSAELIDTPSVLPITQTFRQPPRKRIFQDDQLDFSYT